MPSRLMYSEFVWFNMRKPSGVRSSRQITCCVLKNPRQRKTFLVLGRQASGTVAIVTFPLRFPSSIPFEVTTPFVSFLKQQGSYIPPKFLISSANASGDHAKDF